MKYNLGDHVFYFRDGKLMSAVIFSRKLVENAYKVNNDAQREAFAPFGDSTIEYATIHGKFEESALFPSKEALLASL